MQYVDNLFFKLHVVATCFKYAFISLRSLTVICLPSSSNSRYIIVIFIFVELILLFNSITKFIFHNKAFSISRKITKNIILLHSYSNFRTINNIWIVQYLLLPKVLKKCSSQKVAYSFILPYITTRLLILIYQEHISAQNEILLYYGNFNYKIKSILTFVLG